MGDAMHRRLKNLLPIVLIALAVQIVAPIAACWAAVIAASDPLSAAVICHGKGGAAGAASQDGAPGVQRGCCALCGVLHSGAPVEPPRTAATFTFDRQVTSVVWHELALEPVTSRAGSPEQARAPPPMT
jgi:hypothetical protein